MMEESHAREGHGQILLVTICDDQIVTNGAAGSGNVLDAGGKDPLGVDAEGEESIASRLASDLVL